MAAGDLVLVTGGAGYIGSHTCVELLACGYRVVVLDSLANASPASLAAVQAVAGRQLEAFHRVDVTDVAALRQVFGKHCRNGERFAAVIHFAGLKAVGDSWHQPLEYYRVNVGGSLALLQVMREHHVSRLVFSSSATVYGVPELLPLREDAAVGAVNPYGRTKLMVEEVLRDEAGAQEDMRVLVLRYFNPIGAHASGQLGERGVGPPTNLLPIVGEVLTGTRKELTVFGDDYDTVDGTGVRDYVHVVDLARGHVAALARLQQEEARGWECVNLGTGKGYSVLEVVAAMEAASGRQVPLRIAPRREGDVAACYADAGKALRLLGWRAELTMKDMCRDLWRYLSAHLPPAARL